MGFFSKKQETQEQGKKPRFSMRIIGCVALAYIAIEMLATRQPDSEMPPLFLIGIPIVFLGCSAVFGYFEVRNFIKTWRERKAFEAQEAAEAERMEFAAKAENPDGSDDEDFDDDYDDEDYEDDGGYDDFDGDDADIDGKSDEEK